LKANERGVIWRVVIAAIAKAKSHRGDAEARRRSFCRRFTLMGADWERLPKSPELKTGKA